MQGSDEIVEIFYEVREATKINKKNWEWARADAETFKKEFWAAYPQGKVLDQIVLLTRCRDALPKPCNITALKTALRKSLKKAAEEALILSTGFALCEKSLKGFLPIVNGGDDKIRRLLKILYKKYQNLLKQDEYAVLEIIHEAYPIFMKEPEEERNAEFFLKKATAPDLLRNSSVNKGLLNIDEVTDRIGESIFWITQNDTASRIDEFKKCISSQYELGGNATKIIEAALAACHNPTGGETFKQHMADFLSQFRATLKAQGLERDKLRKALERLRRDLQDGKAREKLMIPKLHSFSSDFRSQGQLMGFVRNAMPNTNEKPMEAVEVLFARFEYWMKKLEKA